MLRRKKPKHFLEQKEALQLAALIAEAQEDKALSRAEKHHQVQPGHPQTKRIPKVSSSKSKIKETKALIAGQRARRRKEKAKLRRGPPAVREQEAGLPDHVACTSQKKVSFA